MKLYRNLLLSLGLLAAGLALTAYTALPVRAADKPFITVASTTSTQNSGLFGYILPKFTAKTGIDVHVVAKGTGQAIRIARNGDADVLLVHHRPSENKFIADGQGVKRFDVMYNDFVIVGPGNDPAHIAGMKDVAKAMAKIAREHAIFTSRGDNSGTNKKEMELWEAAGVDIKHVKGSWYRELGSGMGATLNATAAMGAYTISDRGTWLSFKNRRGLKIVVEGDKRLFNPYGVMLVNPAKHPNVKVKEGQAFIDWLIGPEGQRYIGAYRIKGKQLFHPDAAELNH
ncbi:MAG TPA: substrate-binding domain-containing protein [bacterium]|nr:substrate-binding domain-containing protein [bacterium]